jgi:hypothetical protein
MNTKKKPQNPRDLASKKDAKGGGGPSTGATGTSLGGRTPGGPTPGAGTPPPHP